MLRERPGTVCHPLTLFHLSRVSFEAELLFVLGCLRHLGSSAQCSHPLMLIHLCVPAPAVMCSLSFSGSNLELCDTAMPSV